VDLPCEERLDACGIRADVFDGYDRCSATSRNRCTLDKTPRAFPCPDSLRLQASSARLRLPAVAVHQPNETLHPAVTRSCWHGFLFSMGARR